MTFNGFCESNSGCGRGLICCYNKCVYPVRGDNPKIPTCPDWFSVWGQCILSIQGSAIVGTLNGGGYGGAGCSIILPGIGTVACGTIGAVLGAVGGAILGASVGCFN